MSPTHNQSDLKYYLLSATNPPFEYVEIHDRAFNSWMEIMHDAFKEVGNPDISHLHEDFVRQQVVSCLCSKGEVIATFLHSFASIYTRATRSFRYMKDNFPDTFFEQIKKRGITNVMTSNYMAIHPDWRRGKHSIQVAPVMVGLSLRVRDLFEADAFIGVWRNDRKVNQLAYDQGGECIVANVRNHNTPCDLILMDSRTIYKYPSPQVKRDVTWLWENRVNAFYEPRIRVERKVA